MRNKSFWLILTLLILLVAGFWLWRANDRKETSSNQPNITNFTQCATAGYPVGESHPRQCFGPNGQTFVEQLSDNSDKEGYLVIHFSKDPESLENFDYTVPVERDVDAASSAIEAALVELLKGPTASEVTAGVFTPIKLSGTSNCEGGNFRYTTNASKLTFTFCKQLTLAGIGDDARILAVIEATVAANSGTTPPEVIVLNKNGDCLGDQSGQNQCLN